MADGAHVASGEHFVASDQMIVSVDAEQAQSRASSRKGLSIPRPFRCASRLISIAGWAPPNVLTSDQIQRSLRDWDTPLPYSLSERTGVIERRVCDPGMGIADMAQKAAEQAIYRAEVIPDEIDLIIYAGVCREYMEPATAAVLHDRLALDAATAFDVTDACLGFVDAWMIADSMIATGRVNMALIVAAEMGSTYSDLSMEAIRQGGDPRRHGASLTLGDGAAAIVLGPADSEKGARCRAGIRESRGEHYELCILPRDGEAMESQPGKLIAAALQRFVPLGRSILNESGWTSEDLDLFIPHQPILKSIEKGSRMLNVPFEKGAITLDRYGNMASVSVPFTLAEAMEQGRTPPGARVMLVGFGSGLGVGLLTLQF